MSKAATTTSNLIRQVKAARRVSVPLVAITTPDPAATMRAISESINGQAVKIGWDVVRGLWPCLSGVAEADEAARQAVAQLRGEQDLTIGNPLALVETALRLPVRGMLFMHLAHRWLVDPSVIQGIWNLRDQFKLDGRMLILLAPAIELPAELAGDVVVFDEPLPGPAELEGIVREQHGNLKAEEPDAAELAEGTVARAVEAIQGLPAFQAEQVVAMSLRKAGLDVPALWERKRRQIELTPGLKVHADGVTFSDVGGVEVIKRFLGRILAGQAKPNAVVFIDEIEKFIAGAAGGGGDTSGVSQDQLGTLLSYMQDHGAAGCIFVGPPGSAKSMVAKAAGNEAGIPTIQLDLGGLKGSLVGQSEQNLRTALKVISAVSNGRSLWIATCNAISSLPPELRRRFTLGTYFFDLPDEQERHVIWQLYRVKYGLPPASQAEAFSDDGWTGAEIKQCCDIAHRLGCTLKEAAEFVVPVSRSASEQLERLRQGAEGRFLSASRGGVYRRPEAAGQTNNQPAASRRRAIRAGGED